MSLFRFPRCVRPARGISTPALSSFVPPFACGHTHSSTKGGLGLPENHLRGSKVPPHGNFFSHTCPIVWPPPTPDLLSQSGGPIRTEGKGEGTQSIVIGHNTCIPNVSQRTSSLGNFSETLGPSIFHICLQFVQFASA